MKVMLALRIDLRFPKKAKRFRGVQEAVREG